MNQIREIDSKNFFKWLNLLVTFVQNLYRITYFIKILKNKI